ncbi:MAG: hypothetical protein II875_07215 [Clostridia bacterium]|nr:hypothetical protein [Clostridia bacterium]
MKLSVQRLLKPDSEFSPFPFWFLNGELEESEIDRQLQDFADKGINGVVLHPRIGLSRETGYMTPRYLELIRHAVLSCRRLGIRVMLYDEGMYPSGSAHGEVVKLDPAFAARGIRALGPNEKPLDDESLYKIFAVKRGPDGVISEASELSSPDDGGDGEVMRLCTGFTHGTIRGVHEGEDDGEPGAPKAADLLNAGAMRAFIALTHEKYYEAVGDEFGSTVIGFFTDEPSPVGRNVKKGVLPWSDGFEDDLKRSGFENGMLPYLFDEASAGTPQAASAKQIFSRALCARLKKTYYGPISAWCASHGVALCGHPHSPMVSAVLSEFGIPGQDIVWRWVAPENGLSLSGDESAQAKCASDAARHSLKRRNLNECFGCCGPDGHMWAFNVDDMKWYIDWLCVRGCNLLVPHAFYYSTDAPHKLDRPPDNGPNNIWWDEYSVISAYIKRLCMLNTDCVNRAKIAVLGTCDRLPVGTVKPLYENQIEFNYLTEDDLLACSHMDKGRLCVGKNVYEALMIDPGISYSVEALEKAKRCEKEGLTLLSPGQATDDTYKTARFSGDARNIRVTHTVHENAEALLVVNEGDKGYTGMLWPPFEGKLTLFDAWNGKFFSVRTEDGAFCFRLGPRESLLVLKGIDGSGFEAYEETLKTVRRSMRLDALWKLTLPDGETVSGVGSWTDMEKLKLFSGTLDYECCVELDEKPECLELHLGSVRDKAAVFVNGKHASTLLRPPYSVDVTDFVTPGKNRFTVRVTNALEPHYAKKPWISGLLGPSMLALCEKTQTKTHIKPQNNKT